MTRAGGDLPRLEIRSAKNLEDWLKAHGHTAASHWLVTHKKGHTDYVPRVDVLAALIAHGWVDSLPRKLDDARTMLLISPRKPASNWSAVNKEIAERLIAQGRMTQRGMNSVEIARQNGRWTALDAATALEEPPDLAAALDANPSARACWDRFPPSSRRAILEWIGTAKQRATRARRIATTTERAARNRKANFPKGRDAGPKSSEPFTARTGDV